MTIVMNELKCTCSAKKNFQQQPLICSCSGCADVGEIADRTARKLTAEGLGKMFCLTGVGGRVPGIMKGVADASSLLVIDGCPLDCASNCLTQAGFNEFKHLRLTDNGLTKGSSPADETNVAITFERAAALLDT